MKQKIIIQVWGKANIGKSRTIRILHEEFYKKYIDPNHNYGLNLIANSDEISKTLNYKNYIVGFESMGDFLGYHDLKKHLNDFIEIKQCDILICASRIYNEVNTYIENLAQQNNYRIIKVTNYRGNDTDFSKDEQNKLCKLSAIHLLDLVDEILKGNY